MDRTLLLRIDLSSRDQCPGAAPLAGRQEPQRSQEPPELRNAHDHFPGHLIDGHTDSREVSGQSFGVGKRLSGGRGSPTQKRLLTHALTHEAVRHCSCGVYSFCPAGSTPAASTWAPWPRNREMAQ